MNKIYKLFSALVLFIAGTTVGQAQYWLVDTSESDYPNVKEIEEGVDYALENAYTVEYNDFLNGNTKSTVIPDNGLYNFEKAGVDADGNETWYLKRKSDGKYVKDPNFMLDSESGVTYTSTQAMAFRFVAQPANWVETEEEATAAENPFTTYAADGQDAWILRSVESTAAKDIYFYANGIGTTSPPTFSASRSSNAWKIVTVYEASGYEILNCFIQEKFPNGFSANSFMVGNDVGCVSDAEALDNMIAAYDQAEVLINTASSDVAACNACIEELNKAYDALIASVIQLEAGYYYLVNWRTSDSEKTQGGCVYDSEGSGARWTQNYVIPEKPTVEAAAYIWEFIPSGNYWNLRNYKTQNYLGAVSDIYIEVPVADDPAPYQLVPAEGVNGGDGTLSGYFWIGNFASYTGPAGYNYLHTQVNGLKLVYWDNVADSPGSCWRFTKVDEEDLETLRQEMEKATITTKVEELVKDAEIDIESAKSFISDATPDDNFADEPGLVIYDESLQNITSNALEPDEGENCFYGALTDNNFATYFHSMWSTHPEPNGWHYLEIDLGQEVKDVVLKYLKRDNYNNDATGTGSPTVITVMSTDDAPDAAERNWNEELTVSLSYQYPATYTTVRGAECEPTTLDNRVGITGFEMGAAHRYIRLMVKETIGNGSYYTYPFFYWAELRLYEGQYDEENSILSVMDQTVLQNLRDQISAATAAVADGSVTQANLDALQEAYDKFLEYYPQPESVKELVSEATTIVEGAFEGTELGYYQTGSKAELQAAIDEVNAQVKEVMTIDEVNSCKAKLNAAIEAFYAKLNTPEVGKLYYIRSTSTGNDGAVNGHYLYAASSDLSVIQHGGYVLDEGAEEARPIDNIDSRIDYMWTLCQTEDGKYTLRNLGTGRYLEGSTEVSSDVAQAEETTVGFSLRGTPQLAGSFNFVFAPGIYLNAQPADNVQTAGDLVTWNTATGADNSAFEFEEITEMPIFSSVEVGTYNTIVTLPYSISTEAAGGIYQVSGLKDNAIQLVSFEDGVVPAGTPFVYIPEEGTTETSDMFVLADSPSTPEDMNYNFNAASVNGLVGTLASVEVEAGNGFFIRGMVIAADSKFNIAANSGYFNAQLPAVTEEGEYSLPVYGTIIATGIGNLDVVNNKARMDVYTISGVKVRSNVSGNEALRNLPAGIYIVGGKKVLVK